MLDDGVRSRRGSIPDDLIRFGLRSPDLFCTYAFGSYRMQPLAGRKRNVGLSDTASVGDCELRGAYPFAL